MASGKRLILIIGVIVIAGFFFTPELGQFVDGGGGGIFCQYHYKVNVVWLSCGVPFDQAGYDNMKKMFSQEGSSNDLYGVKQNYYSVNSFYAKYSVGLTESYSHYSVVIPLKYSIYSTYTSFDYGRAIVTVWAKLNPNLYYSAYDSSNLLVFIIQGTREFRPFNVGYTSVSIIDGSSNHFSSQYSNVPEVYRYSLAHEIGHSFGALDQYKGMDNTDSSPYSHGLMYDGGNGMGMLTKGYGNHWAIVNGHAVGPVWGNIDTIFCSADLKVLHFSYVTKLDRYYITNWW